MTVRTVAAGVVRGLLAVWLVVTLGILVAMGLGAVTDRELTVVTTGSMRPTVEPDDMVALGPVDASVVAVGDVVSYRLPDQADVVVLHRVVEVVERGSDRFFVMKGDANSVVDARPVADDYLTGRLIGAVPRVGGLLRLAAQPPWQVVLVATPLVLAFMARLLEPPARRRPPAGHPAPQ
jgi:signal peptidase I